jgi:hypothetical protein
MATRLPLGAIPLRVSGSGRFLFVGRERIAVPYRVDRLELATGVTFMTGAVLTPDGEAYAYTYERDLHDLYLIEGLRP